jgi:diguanylate cyclase
VNHIEMVQNPQKDGRFSLILLEIDFFGPINNLWGRQVGDYVLLRLDELIKRNLLEGDSVTRYRGKEFLILLPEAEGRKATVVAEKIRSAVENVKWPNGMSVTVSAGVAYYPEDGERLMELLKNVKRALAYARSGGRNRVRCACHQVAKPVKC